MLVISYLELEIPLSCNVIIFLSVKYYHLIKYQAQTLQNQCWFPHKGWFIQPSIIFHQWSWKPFPPAVPFWAEHIKPTQLFKVEFCSVCVTPTKSIAIPYVYLSFLICEGRTSIGFSKHFDMYERILIWSDPLTLSNAKLLLLMLIWKQWGLIYFYLFGSFN